MHRSHSHTLRLGPSRALLYTLIPASFAVLNAA